MPIYDYQCSSCGFKSEVMRKMSEPSVTACPQCAKDTFAKQVSAPSFRLSGSGWYATDFKNGSKKPDTQTADKSSGAAEPKSAEAATTASAAPCATSCACH